jgi:hypothetical protein
MRLCDIFKIKDFTEAGRHEIDSSQINLAKKS